MVDCVGQWWVRERQSLQELLDQKAVFFDGADVGGEVALEEHPTKEAKDHTAETGAVKVESIFDGVAVDLHNVLENMVSSVFYVLPVKVKRHQEQVLEVAFVFGEVFKEDAEFFGDGDGGVEFGGDAGDIAARHQGEHLLEESFFVGEVVIEQACGDVEFTGKFAHGDRSITALCKQGEAGGQEFFATLIMIHNLGHRRVFLVVGKRRQAQESLVWENRRSSR